VNDPASLDALGRFKTRIGINTNPGLPLAFILPFCIGQ
jgi:hypothetical protein